MFGEIDRCVRGDIMYAHIGKYGSLFRWYCADIYLLLIRGNLDTLREIKTASLSVLYS